ncbi:hypothetical protein IB286_03460 [Spongiibacter sp. KMU-158]|uniref:Uncharacterized protein n=1 Tax=Spongiibacter pelagi TaxID=2760804 RepID=A0A927C111_9GAMM|nr:hypothetical protein [Spongiibacter pelagi]MBD2858052.1 hypothetical protein [Spongiibacter pelagi]
MNRENYATETTVKRTRRRWMGLLSLGLLAPLAMTVSKPAEAGEVEAAAAVLLGAAIIVAAQDDHRDRRVTHVHTDNHHRWSHRNGRRFCDTHSSFHIEVNRPAYSHSHGYTYYSYGAGRDYRDRHSYHDRHSYNDRHSNHGKHGYSDRHAYGDKHKHHGDKGGRAGSHHASNGKGWKNDRHHHAEAKWNTRVKAY